MPSTDGSLHLQQSIDQLAHWSNIWQLKNSKLLFVMLYLFVKNCRYLLGGFYLNNVSINSDINLDSNLFFKSHISRPTIITKALQWVGIFFEEFGYCSKNVHHIRSIRRTQLFITYVAYVEQNCNVWNPTCKYLTENKIGNVQLQFTKCITSISHLTLLQTSEYFRVEAKRAKTSMLWSCLTL